MRKMFKIWNDLEYTNTKADTGDIDSCAKREHPKLRKEDAEINTMNTF